LGFIRDFVRGGEVAEAGGQRREDREEWGLRFSCKNNTKKRELFGDLLAKFEKEGRF